MYRWGPTLIVFWRSQKIAIVPKIREISWSETGWWMRYIQRDTSVLFTNADSTFYTSLHKVIVTDNNLKYDVVGVTEIDHDWASEFLYIVHT